MSNHLNFYIDGQWFTPAEAATIEEGLVMSFYDTQLPPDNGMVLYWTGVIMQDLIITHVSSGIQIAFSINTCPSNINPF